MAIITTAEYKTYANISGSTLDAQLNVLIPGLQAELERQTGRVFDKATFTEYFDGALSPTLGLSNYPITSIATIQAIDRAEAVTYLFPATTYKIEAATGLVSRQVAGYCGGSDWGWGWNPLPQPFSYSRAPEYSDGWRNIKVVYDGGYEAGAAPADLKLLMYDLVSTRLAQIGQDLSMKSETLGHYKYDRGAGAAGTDIWTIYATRVAAWKRVST